MKGAVAFWAGVAFSLLALGLIAFGRGPADELLPLVAALVYIGVGRMLTARQPENAVSHLIAALGVVLAVTSATDAYLKGATAADPTLVLQLVSMVNALIWNLWLWALVALALPLLFPDGRLPSPRWRWVAWTGAGGVLLGTIATLLAPGTIDADTARHVANPFGVARADGVLSTLDGLASALQVVGVLGAGAAIVVRLRRSRGVERLQLKWFAYVAALLVAGLAFASATSSLASEDSAIAQVGGPIGWFTALAMAGFGIPAATGVAVLRHRLYEIDVVINRTLVYASLTATLAATYLGTVLLLQLALDPITSGSSLAVAVSTLAVAALFRPARARIQGAVDRRFYRHSYDAARTLEQFTGRLREQVDLEALGGELSAVVRETMQPAHVSLWLREARR